MKGLALYLASILVSIAIIYGILKLTEWVYYRVSLAGIVLVALGIASFFVGVLSSLLSSKIKERSNAR